MTRRLEKNRQIFQKIAQKLPSQKKVQKYLQQSSIWKPKTSTTNHFGTSKVAQLAKNLPIWSPWLSFFVWVKIKFSLKIAFFYRRLKVSSHVRLDSPILWFKLHSFNFLVWNEPKGQCYKTFYDHKLRIFIISKSVCPWQAFPAWHKRTSLIRKVAIYDRKKFYNIGRRFQFYIKNTYIIYKCS